MSPLRPLPVLAALLVGCASSSSGSSGAPRADASLQETGGGSGAGTGSGSGGGPDAGKKPGSGSGTSHGSGAGGSGSGTGAGHVDASFDAPSTVDGPPSPSSPVTLRVHYPVGTHALTVSGSHAPLSWGAGVAMTSAGNDTWTFTLPPVTEPLEWKPLLDGTWAIGPNYRALPGQTVDIYPHFTTTAGTVKTLIASFHSTVLNNDRPIYAYLPPSYAENPDATYPVVYMHDGQNLWAALPGLAFSVPWNVDTSFDAASNTGTCSSGGLVGWGAQPLGGTATTCTGDSDCPSGECRTFPEAIVIGVANMGAGRAYEYTPTVDPSEADAGLGAMGGADKYLQMLITELKPAIDGQLRTRKDVASTAMAGSSLGGLVTAYAGVKHPEVYGMIADISPSSFWDNDVIVTDVKGTGAAPGRPLIVYVDSGQGTADDESDTDLLAAAYLALGYVDGTNFRHVAQAGAIHGETYWAERFPGAMQLLLGVR